MASEDMSGFAVRIEIPILWSDEDSFAHVNNVTYLRWCEEGRIAYLREIGLLPESPPRGIGPIVASITCQYLAPLSYPGRVEILTRVVHVGNSSFRTEQRIVSKDSGTVAAEAHTVMVTVDYSTGAPVRIPDEVRAAIARLEDVHRVTKT